MHTIQESKIEQLATTCETAHGETAMWQIESAYTEALALMIETYGDSGHNVNALTHDEYAWGMGLYEDNNYTIQANPIPHMIDAHAVFLMCETINGECNHEPPTFD